MCRLYFWGGVAYFQGGIFMWWQVGHDNPDMRPHFLHANEQALRAQYCMARCLPLHSRSRSGGSLSRKLQGTMRFGTTAKELAECKLMYYRISECRAP